jgi:DNA-directed RNA polymerase subunit RPC12/RpoP
MAYKYGERQMIARMVWLDKVMALPDGKMSPTTKVVIAALSEDFAVRGIPHTQMSKLWIDGGLTSYSGLNKKTVGQHIDILANAGAYIKERRIEKKPDGVTVPRIWGAFSAQFYPVILVNLPDRATRKERQRVSIRCPHCGEYHNLQRYSFVHCGGCGVEIEEMRETEEIENVAPCVRPDELARLDQQVEAYEAIVTLAEMPREDLTREQEAETFRRAMKVAQTTNGTMEAF